MAIFYLLIVWLDKLLPYEEEAKPEGKVSRYYFLLTSTPHNSLSRRVS